MNRRLNIVIIGGVAAGPSAAAKAKRINPLADVTLFESGADVSYGVCEMPYLISGELGSPDDLVIFTPEKLAEKKQIQVFTKHRVQRILPTKRRILVNNLESGGVEEVAYDKLILALGASPKALPVIPKDAENCFHFTSLNNTRAVLAYLEQHNPKSVCIIGGGYIGIEAAEAFKDRGMDVTLVYNNDLPFPYLDTESRNLLHEVIVNAGILLTSRLEAAMPEAGMGYELQVIAATVIGGTSLTGGKGRLFGTVIGAMVMGVIQNGLNLLAINVFWHQVVIGSIILLAVGIDRFSQRKAAA